MAAKLEHFFLHSLLHDFLKGIDFHARSNFLDSSSRKSERRNVQPSHENIPERCGCYKCRTFLFFVIFRRVYTTNRRPFFHFTPISYIFQANIWIIAKWKRICFPGISILDPPLLSPPFECTIRNGSPISSSVMCFSEDCMELWRLCAERLGEP